MIDEDLRQRLVEHSASLPGATEDHPWGELVFKVKGKIFVFFGPVESSRMTVKARPEELEALLALPHVERAAYVGRFGWVTVDFARGDGLDEARELILDSHGLIASPRRR